MYVVRKDHVKNLEVGQDDGFDFVIIIRDLKTPLGHFAKAHPTLELDTQQPPKPTSTPKGKRRSSPPTTPENKAASETTSPEHKKVKESETPTPEPDHGTLILTFAPSITLATAYKIAAKHVNMDKLTSFSTTSAPGAVTITLTFAFEVEAAETMEGIRMAISGGEEADIVGCDFPEGASRSA
ncbi:hypothetical protein HDV00_008850 [Rhizophlyctis rosea]|nr:hypothetical protein HDV00_008850 [Rhizophlyctis rosea]